jgi:hypothetical protein
LIGHARQESGCQQRIGPGRGLCDSAFGESE